MKRDFSKKIEEFRNKSNQEKLTFLSGFWEFDIQNEPFKLIGTYEKAEKPDKNGKEYGFFINVRSLNGDTLYYPFNLGQVRIWVEHKENLSKQGFWLFDVKLNEKKEIKNPFQLNLANRTFGNPKNFFLDRIKKEKLIRKIFDETGSTQRDAKNLSNALKRIAGDLYTETERFIFELLQNADDIPNERGEVDVLFNLLSENLLFLHNGKPFDNSDVESISSIGDSTKRKDAEKTGYKGIGFKSVFTDAETVLINSGNFSFSFDKHSPLYETLYESQNIEEIPWEIKPIWTEVYRYPKEVRNNEEFFKYPVAIDLEVGNEKIILYRQQISQLFSEPRFILFLRHIKNIEVLGLNKNIKIQKQKKNERFELLSNENPVNEWCIDDYNFSVSQEIRDAMANDKVIPEKLKEIQKSKLSFACQINDNEITSISPDKSFLFTYLPTNVNDYSFPFLVNADFLTTANRQSIHIKNPWNLFLFEQIGYLCFEWISKLAQIKEIRNSITNLIPQYYKNGSEPVHLHFNKGFDKALTEIAFLPTYQPKFTKVSDAIVDLTGFSDVIGEKLFEGTQFTEKNLVTNELQNKETLSELKGITIFDKEKLKRIIANHSFGALTDIKELLEIFNRNKELGIDSCDIRDIIENVHIDCINKWIKECDAETYEAFLKELDDCYLRKETKERICEIGLFKFSDDLFYSVNETRQVRTIRKAYQKQVYNSYSRTYQQQTQYRDETTIVYQDIIFNSEKTFEVSTELQKLGFKTSLKCLPEYQNIFSALSDKLPSDEQLYTKIAEKCETNTLLPQEKKKLFLNFIDLETKFSGVAAGTLKDLWLFCDNKGEIKPLKELVNSNFNARYWISPYKIKAEENFAELNSYLISDEKEVFEKIIFPNSDTIIPEIQDDAREIKALIEFFKNNEKQFFNRYILQKTANGFLIIPKTNDKYQITSPDNDARKFIDENCKDKLFVLPIEFLEWKEEDGIIKADDLHSLILDCVDVNEYKQSLIDIVKYRAKYQFLQKLSEFRFNSETAYTKDDYEYKVLELACNELKESDYLNFKNKVVIETANDILNLNIPLSKNEFEIENVKLSLSEVLPDVHKNSSNLSKLINRFVSLGLPEDKINLLFGIKNEPEQTLIFNHLRSEYKTLQNGQQLAFVLLYAKTRNLNLSDLQLPDETKIDFIEFVYKQNNTILKELIISSNSISLLNFNPQELVYPNEYACESEQLPDFVQKWIDKDDEKIKFLANLGVWIEGTTIVDLRKFWKGEGSFDGTKLVREDRFDTDKPNLINSFEYLQTNSIQLTTTEQYEVFEEAIKRVNLFSYITIANNFETIRQQSKEWDDNNYYDWKERLNKFSIYLFNGELPSFLYISGQFENYVFYHFNKGDFAIDGNIIFLNENTSIKDTLWKLAAEKNNFTYDDWGQLFNNSDETEKLKQEIALLKSQLQLKPDNAILGTKFGTDISKNDQIETNREAKEIVKERLESEGFIFTKGIGDFSAINGVEKNGIQYPLVVKSYKWQDEPLKIGANEWIQLMKPNSMFWVHFGNRKLGCLKLYELLRKQDKLTISFSTENLDNENRLENFAELLHYFGDVHFDFNSIKPDNYSRANTLNDYRFDERKTEEDLTPDNDDLL